MVTPDTNVSAFDANMAADAGYQIIIPHTGLSTQGIAPLVQDAIFSRPPKNAANTGVFIGGYDVNVAADMLDAARKAMVGPFELSVFADPNGAFTTSAALITVVEKHLQTRTGVGLEGRIVKIFGGGPVGLCVSILASNRGAAVSLVRLTTNAQRGAVEEFSQRFGMEIPSENATRDSERVEAVADAEVIVCTAKAGIQVLDKSTLQHATKLIVAADVNAVPPAGIEGVGVVDDGAEVIMNWGSFCAVGALGIGRVKYDVQHRMFKQMMSSENAVVLDLLDAYQLAAAN